MKHGSHWLALAVCVGTCPVVVAQDDDRDVTMTVIEDEAEATERDFVQDIQLPEPARGREEAPGRSVAEDAREGGERGNERASEARQQGGEEERGRSDEAREGEQGGRPDDPGRPNGGGD